MKRAINILIGLVLFVAQAFAQVQPDPRVLVKQAGAVTNDLLQWDGTKWTPGRPDVAVVADSAAFRAFNQAVTPKTVMMSDSLRGGKFRRCYSCSADQYMTFSDALGRKWERFDFGATVFVTWYGAKPGDDASDSIGIQKSLNSPYNVFFPPGNYYGATHTINTGKKVWGNNATITQRSLLSTQARIITILTDNVTIEGLALVGQIATQSSEFSHGISVGKPISDITGTGVKNIVLRNLTISGIRGDGIIVAASGLASPYFCENIHIENVVMDNIYRNGIAIISGKNITISGLKCTRIGLWGVDLEPDIATQYGEQISVLNYYGPGIAFGHHLALNKNITVENFYCDGTLRGSVPAYIDLPLFKVGVNIRQTSNILLKNGIVRRFGGYGLEIGNSDLSFRNVVLDAVTFDSIAYDAAFSNSKIIDQTNATSDSAFTFVNCSFDGRGVVAQVGLPTASTVKNCVFRRFVRLMDSSPGKHKFVDCDIDCYNDLIYSSNGGSVFENCNIACSYLVRGEGTDGNLYTWRNCVITSSLSTPPYTFFGGSPNTRFILDGNILNGTNAQAVAAGETVFSDHVIVTGTGSATITVPTVLAHPLNRIAIDNTTDGRTVTIDPEGSALINGAATFATTTNAVITTNQTDWFSPKTAVTSDLNGIYSGSGTVPNATTATVTDDLTFAVNDATGNQDAKFRIVATGTDPGVQVWRNGADSLQLSFIDSEPHLTFAGSAASDFWINTGAHDLRITGTALHTYTVPNVLGGYVATPYLQVSDNVTVSEADQEIDIIGNTGPVTLTFQYTSNLLGTAAKTVTVRNRSAYNATLSRGAQSWQWSDMTGTNTTGDKTLAPGETAKMFWVDAGVTDYYVLHIMPATFGGGGSTGETIISPAQLTAAADNWNPSGLSTATVIRLSGDNGFRIISGITAPASPKELTLTNVGTDYPVLITREDAASSAANRFAIERDVPLYPNQSATFYYDATATRWRLRNQSAELRPEQTAGVFFSTGSTTAADYDHWMLTAASGAFATTAPTATRRRATTVSTAASASAGPHITTKAASIWIGLSPNPTAMYYRSTFSVDSLSNATWGNYTVVAGFTSGPNALTSTTPEGEYFKYTHNILSGKWGVTTKQTTGAPNATTTDTGITFAAQTIYTLEVLHRPDGAAAFFLNGSYVTEHTTHIEAQYAYPIVFIKKGSGTVARILTLDEIVFEENRL